MTKSIKANEENYSEKTKAALIILRGVKSICEKSKEICSIDLQKMLVVNIAGEVQAAYRKGAIMAYEDILIRLDMLEDGVIKDELKSKFKADAD